MSAHLAASRLGKPLANSSKLEFWGSSFPGALCEWLGCFSTQIAPTGCGFGVGSSGEGAEKALWEEEAAAHPVQPRRMSVLPDESIVMNSPTVGENFDQSLHLIRHQRIEP